jgi:hypothetical protein
LVVAAPVAALYPYNAYRILFPHLPLACLVPLGSERFVIIKVLIGVHLSLGLWFIGKFRDFQSPRVHTPVAAGRLVEIYPLRPDCRGSLLQHVVGTRRIDGQPVAFAAPPVASALRSGLNLRTCS